MKSYYKIPGKLVASICELNQWAMDFDGNLERIRESILISKAKGATYRLGPELEVTGYNCQDHFNEFDTIAHGYEVLAAILADPELYDIVIDIGLPVMHDGVRYNARAVCLNGDLLLIRPKTVLANDGMYHEERWFVGWKKTVMGLWVVPHVISKVINKHSVPIGVCVMQFRDVSIGIEMCEELFVPNSWHNLLSMNGAHVIVNGNGSHFQIGKINKRFSLVADASGKTGCTYLYGNLQGCDGSTMFFDGGSFVASSGKIVSMCKRFKINSGCKVLITTIDVNEIRSRRAVVVSLCKASAESQILPKIYIESCLCKDFDHEYDDVELMDPYDVISKNNVEIDDIIGAPSCFLWDYLKKSGTRGFFVPLSGGSDSSTVGLLVYHMAERFCQALKREDEAEKQKLLTTIRSIVRDETFTPTSPSDICNRILFTAYMGSRNSSEATKLRAGKLAQFINSKHYDLNIDDIVDTFVSTFSKALSFTPQFKCCGGSEAEDLALQNVQARTRMVLSYLVSQLSIQLSGDDKSHSSLLVLGTSNRDEIASGYFTKYDCSSGDISPISTLGKNHIHKILAHFYHRYGQEVINEINVSTPSAELVPVTPGHPIQSDEGDLEITYPELKRLCELRSTLFCGPLSMFNHLLDEWGKLNVKNPDPQTIMDPYVVAEKVRKFFILYSKNRHKAVVLPPAVHLCVTAQGGRHYDLRPFLYNISWSWQFKCMDRWLRYRLNMKNQEFCFNQSA